MYPTANGFLPFLYIVCSAARLVTAVVNVVQLESYARLQPLASAWLGACLSAPVDFNLCAVQYVGFSLQSPQLVFGLDTWMASVDGALCFRR